MGYKAIDQRFWSDDLVLEYFTVIDRIVFIYLLTNGRTAITGCYSDSVYLISQGTGVSREDGKTSLEHLELLGRILWDRETREILLMNYGRYNWNLSPKFVKGAYASAETIRSDNLRSIVADKLNEFVANKSRIPLPRGYDTYGYDNGSGYGDEYGNGYGYGYGTGDGDGTGNGNGDGVKTEKEADFEKFWAAYPRKVGKPDALKAFVKADVTMEQQKPRADFCPWLFPCLKTKNKRCQYLAVLGSMMSLHGTAMSS